LDLVESIPKDLYPHIRGELQPGELLIILLSADIRPDGQYGDSWFALTDERILVFHPNGSDKPETLRLNLDEVQKVQTRNYVGSGALVVELEDETVELLRFSQSAFYKFSSVPQAIEAAGLVEEEDQADNDDPHADPVKIVEHCHSCGRAFRPGTKICPSCLRKTETFWRLFSYIKPYRNIALLGSTLTILLTVIGLLPPLLNQALLDDVIFAALAEEAANSAAAIGEQEADKEPAAMTRLLLTAHGLFNAEKAGPEQILFWVVIGLLGVYISRGLVSGVRMYALGWLGQRIVYDLQTQIFQHLQLLSLTFYNNLSTGRIMTRVTSDTERMRGFITSGFQDIVIDALTIIGICVMLFTMNWQLAFFALIPIPFMIVGTIVYRTRIHWIFHRIWRRIASLNAMLADTIPGVKVVKAFAQEERELQRFNERNLDLRDSRMTAFKMRSYYIPSIAFITSVGSIILWWFGGKQVLNGELSPGELQAFIAYMVMFYAPVRSLCNLTEELESAATTAERVFEIIDTEPEVQDHYDAVDPGQLQGKIEFRNVSFTYDGSARILDRIDFATEPGEMIGIVGPSGAGKSTFVNLMTRFYDATDGQIRIDGQPITMIKQRALRAQIGVVLQEPLLFQGSIASNIAYGHPEATRQQIIEAARAANAHKFIMNFPEGYDTQVGERGGRLSGGERQRISIARALIGDPRILILDEATASVDTHTEYEIQEALERLVAGRTTFAIAHRLSTLKNADRLLVLDRGRVAEVGTHEELLGLEDGVYRNLVDMQTEMAKVRAIL